MPIWSHLRLLVIHKYKYKKILQFQIQIQSNKNQLISPRTYYLNEKYKYSKENTNKYK